jgi:hypothetical protein
MLTEATALPPQDGVGRHDDQGLPPAGPDPGQPDPQEAIRRAQSGPRCSSFVHGELLAQGEVLEGELTMTAAEERKRRSRWSSRVIIEPGLSPDRSCEINDLPAERVWRRTGQTYRFSLLSYPRIQIARYVST